MTNISKHPLEQKVEGQLFKQLTTALVKENTKQSADFFNALFSRSEKIMFIKRLAVVFYLSNGFSSYRIAKSLTMSQSTVQGIRLQFEEGRYDPIVKLIRKKAFDTEKFWSMLEVLLKAGMPSRSAKKRWSKLT